MKKRRLIGFGLAACVIFSGCDRGTKRVEVDDGVVKSAKSDVQHVESGEIMGDALIGRVEALRDREFRRRPVLVAEAGAWLGDSAGAGAQSGDEAVQEVKAALEADRAAISQGLMGRASGGDGLGDLAKLAKLARYDRAAATVTYANGHGDRDLLRLAVVLALVEGLNAEYFEGYSGAETWDGALALEAAASGDAMFVAVQVLLEEMTGKAISADELALFPELALKHETLRGVLDSGFAGREGYALAAALYRAGGWSAVEVLKHGPPGASGYVVRPDRWFSGDDLGVWRWPTELEAGWDDEVYWYPKVRSGRVGPAMIAMWLGETIDPVAARTVYAGWRSDAYRKHAGKRIASARRPGATVFEWVSQWDTPHSAGQVADAFRMVLERGQAERKDGARHVVLQKGVNVAVIVTDSDDERFRGDSKMVDRAGVLGGAVVRYGEVAGPPFVFRPTRLEAFLVGARDARLVEDVFEDPGSGVTMDLSALAGDWTVQKTDEASIRWFARLGKGQDGALMQFTTELQDVLGPEFGTDAYRQKMEGVFGVSLGETSSVKAEVLKSGVVEIRGEGKIGGKARALWVRQFLVGDVLCTLSLQDVPQEIEAHSGVFGAVFDGISFEASEAAASSASNEGDGVIRIEVEGAD